MHGATSAEAATPATEPDFATDFYAPLGYDATWVKQTQSNTFDQFFEVQPCEELPFSATFRNTGTKVWQATGNSQVAFNVYRDRAVIAYPHTFTIISGEQESYFAHEHWLSPYRIATIPEKTLVGEDIDIPMTFQVPCSAEVGIMRQDISMAAGPGWMPNRTNGDALGVAHLWVGFVIGRKGMEFQTTDSGLRYFDDKKGAGEKVVPGKQITIHYTAKLGDGRIVDDTRETQNPISFVIGEGNELQVWDEALLGMQVGGKRTLIVPPHLAYGPKGIPGKVHPNAYIVIDNVEILDVSDKPMPQEGNYPFIESGRASFYSKNWTLDRFYYRKWAKDGNRFAAHKTLPIGTRVLVKNTENGKTTIVTIIDRGPYVKGRVIDLSYWAFDDIANLGDGTAPVNLYKVVDS